MPTTPLGIWTPDDNDDWDLTVDLAAMAISADDAISYSSVRPFANAAARDTAYPAPVQGDRALRLDTGWTEMYYGLYNSTTNPGGASTAGWYPISGRMPYFKALGTSTLSVPNNTATVGNIAFTSGFQHGGFTASGASAYEINVPFPGLYDVWASVDFASSAGGSYRRVAFVVDGTQNPDFLLLRSSTVGAGATTAQATQIAQAINAKIAIQVNQDSGGALNSTRRVLVGKYLGPVGVIQN